MTTASDLAAAGTATLGEAWEAARVIDNPPLPLTPEMSVAGVALTVQCKPGDNLAIHRAIAAAPCGGAVLVVDYGGCVSSGPFGEIMAVACQMRGIVGLIIDGAVRDSVQIAQMGFPVFARGKNIRGTKKDDHGALDIPLEMGGTIIQPGEMVVADADGIVVFPQHEADDALTAAQVRLKGEDSVMARLRAGETTMQIFQLDKSER
ncbi:RraA family protein [Celeribacter sp.]|uniref:RraA family protein n=1 Tax=Celeribacter sp. TaxID=1890673 RepID=UPI003A8E9BCF